MRNSSVIGRIAAIGAVLVAVVALGIILLGGGSTYQVKAIFENASQIVTGDQVTYNWRIPRIGTAIVQIDADPAELIDVTQPVTELRVETVAP